MSQSTAPDERVHAGVYRADARSVPLAIAHLPLEVRASAARAWLAARGWLEDEAVRDALERSFGFNREWNALLERDPVFAVAQDLLHGRSLASLESTAPVVQPILLRWWDAEPSAERLFTWLRVCDERACVWGLAACVDAVFEHRPVPPDVVAALAAVRTWVRGGGGAANGLLEGAHAELKWRSGRSVAAQSTQAVSTLVIGLGRDPHLVPLLDLLDTAAKGRPDDVPAGVSVRVADALRAAVRCPELGAG